MDRYTNKHILETPDLKPERHYESSADFSRNIEDTHVDKPPHPLLPVLQRLMDLEGMADLVPRPERDIVKAVTKSMIKLTKGTIIDTIIHYPDPGPLKEKTGEPPDISTYTYKDVPSVLDYEIKMEEPESLYSIAYAAYVNDYNDIAKEYASSMEQVLNRFFQTMVSLSDDCNMPVYTYLLRDFDGEAVQVDDEDLLPAKDLIIKNQAIRNRDLSLMQKIYTEENTLLYGRAWAIGEKERERYLKADYKTNTSSLCTTLGNQMLTDSRNESYKKYRAGMSSMYKYLNSSVINTAQALDKRTYEATAKGQLALNGVDIFKQSPIPKPYDYSKTADDNKQVTQSTTDSIGSSIDEGINNVMPETVPAGVANGGGANGSSITGKYPVNTAELSNWAKGRIGPDLMAACQAISSKTGIRLTFVCAQQIREAGYEDNPYHNYGGLKAGDYDLGFFGSNSHDHTIFHNVDEYAEAWCTKVIVVQRYLKELVDTSNKGDAAGFIHLFKEAGYFAADETEYLNGFEDILRDITTE